MQHSLGKRLSKQTAKKSFEPAEETAAFAGNLKLRTSEQRVDKRRDAGAGKENENAEDQERQDERQEPPFFVLLHESPELAQQAGFGLLGGGFFKLSWLVGAVRHGLILPKVGTYVSWNLFGGAMQEK